MNTLMPFLLLTGRAAAFWLGAVTLISISIVMIAVAGDTQAAPHAYLDITFLAALVYPAAAGWLAGALIQELQHCSFTWPLPGVRGKIARGFLVVGILVTLVVVGLIALSDSPYSMPVLACIGFTSYCFGAILKDPLSRGLTVVNITFALTVIAWSQLLGRLCQAGPMMAIAAASGIAVFSVYRLFAIATFRRKPFLPQAPLPGAFSINQTLQHERAKQARLRMSRRPWQQEYLGAEPAKWVRAAVHESYGSRGPKAIWEVFRGFWVIWIFFALGAWADWIEQGEESYWLALGKTTYEALFRSPHLPTYGEKPPYEAVALIIAALGAAMALWAPVALKGGMVYPLSRRGLARVTFRAGLVESAFFALGIAATLTLFGQSAAWLVGYEVRMDFVPFFVRPLLATLIFVPAARLGRLHLQEAVARRTENLFVPLVLGMIGFVTVVCLWTFLTPEFLVTPELELATTGIFVAASQMVYWRQIKRYYATADLARA